MPILHVTTGANYNVTKAYIRFINDEFEQDEHVFLVIDRVSNIPSDLLEHANAKIVNRDQPNYKYQLYKYMSRSEKVIFHSLWLDPFSMLFLLFRPSFFKKIYWVAWGMDLYQWKSSNRGIHYKVKNLISFKFRQNIKHFVGIFPPDIDFFEKEFKSKAQTYFASYVGNLYSDLYKTDAELSQLENKVANNMRINIQIGHSSTKVLKHLEVLEKLEKFKDYNIKIYLPLSYGDKIYGDIVEKKAKQIFGKNAVCMREMIDKSEYIDFLKKIDIAIFNTSRQIGLGNISPLLFMGKKIFMPKGSVMFEFYKAQGIKVCNYDELLDVNFKGFINPISNKAGREYILENELNKEKKIEMWSKVFTE